MSIDSGIGKAIMGYSYKGRVLSLKKEGASLGCGNMDGLAGRYANVTKSGKCIIALTGGI